MGRQSDAVPSTTPATAGWTKTSRGSLSFGRTDSSQCCPSRGAGGRPRAVVARGGTGGRPRDKKRVETQGSTHCQNGRQEVGSIDGQERVSEHGRTHSRRVGRVRDDASTKVGGAIPTSLSTERALTVCPTTRGIVHGHDSCLPGGQLVATTSQETSPPTRRMVECQRAQTAGVRLDEMVVGPTTSSSRPAWRMAECQLASTARGRPSPMESGQEAYKTTTPLRWTCTRRPRASWAV